MLPLLPWCSLMSWTHWRLPAAGAQPMGRAALVQVWSLTMDALDGVAMNRLLRVVVHCFPNTAVGAWNLGDSCGSHAIVLLLCRR